LIPTTTRFDILHAKQRLWAHCNLHLHFIDRSWPQS
jgi:hypothetical protein